MVPEGGDVKNRKIYNQSIALDNEGKLNNLNK